MNPSIGLHGTAHRGPADPFRGVSRAEVPVRYANPRERALADTAVPPWQDLSKQPIYETPSPARVRWRAAACLSRIVTGMLLLPALFGLAVVSGGFVGSLVALELQHACIFGAIALFFFQLVGGLLRWTVQAPPTEV